MPRGFCGNHPRVVGVDSRPDPVGEVLRGFDSMQRSERGRQSAKLFLVLPRRGIPEERLLQPGPFVGSQITVELPVQQLFQFRLDHFFQALSVYSSCTKPAKLIIFVVCRKYRREGKKLVGKQKKKCPQKETG